MNIKETVIEVIYAVIPITLLITIINFTFAKLPNEVFIKFLGGALFIMIGLILFQLGVKIGFLPMGEMVGSAIVSKFRMWLMLFFGFIIGFVVTVAEPDVQVLARQVEGVSGGTIGKGFIISYIAIGVGIFISIALLRIFLNVSIKKVLIGGYIMVFALSLFTSPDFLAIGFDAGGVTTGPMTVPFILSLGLGVASVSAKKESNADSFGMVALASVGPIMAVLLMGVFFR